MHLTPADKALAEKFTFSLERRPARRSPDELTEADLQAIDTAYSAAKASGALQRESDRRALADQVRMQHATGFTW